MYLKNLQVSNFKNYEENEFDFHENVNCFVGKNGSGKTNLLDAIHYLSFCKSYFSSQDNYSIRFNCDFFAIHGLFESFDNKTTAKISCVFKNGRKTMKANQKEYQKLSDHIGLFPLIMVSPYDSDIISEGSETRRKFLDITISQFDKEYLQQLIVYQKIIQQRNQLLKQYLLGERVDLSVIQIYNDQLIPRGNYIFEKRKQFIFDILPDFLRYHKTLSEDKEKVSILYQSQLFDIDFKKGLQENEIQDFRSSYTNFGVHKDDFIFLINEKQIKQFGSQGQQKSFLLALKLAQYDYIATRKKLKPILLLDDIFDKLDNFRIAQLLHMLGQNHFGQVFITDTDEKRLQKILGKHQILSKVLLI
ncbi:MAG: DNA replication/repair protein RecF [Bacteroidales bacterium]|jgi:DNA replication and repair protein RecF|nr:DNA replication/repair protein RecF [Bacteroidales bacterium]